MAEDRVLPGAWWDDSRLTGLPPVGRLAYLWLSAHADRDGLVGVDEEGLAKGVGIEGSRGGTLMLLLQTFGVAVSYGEADSPMVWLPEFSTWQPPRGALRVEPNFNLAAPPQSAVKEWLSVKLERIATEKECKDSCPRAYGMKRAPRCHDYDHAVQEVWMTWRNRQKHPDSCRFSSATQRIIRGALNQARHEDLVALIVYAYDSSDSPARFWRGENNDKRTYLGLDNLFRAAKLQGRLQMVLDWKKRMTRSDEEKRIEEVDLGPFARRV